MPAQVVVIETSPGLPAELGIRFSGRLDRYSSSALLSVLKTAMADDWRRINVDFGEAYYVDCSALRPAFNLRDQAKAAGKTITFGY